MKTKGLISIMLSASVAVMSCTWVKPGPRSGQVVLESLQDINFCRKLGEVTATTLESVAFFDRDRSRMAEELVQLARNEAEVMGGDTIAPLGEIEGGEQRYGIYVCRDGAAGPP